ncbi:uncharacterized protein [Ptychodera flava]|uniref:uncharacterized protein isoform X1 n=1 Tax=Ptychodera flava TaxID=63121 RepID=UPI003969BE86
MVPSLNMQHVKSFVAAIVWCYHQWENEKKIMTTIVVKNTAEYVNSTKTVSFMLHPAHPVKKKKKSTRDSSHDDDVDLFDFEAEEGEEEGSEEEMKYYFFDFECTQDEGVHVPNLCIVQSESCSEQVFYGPNTKQEFCDWALTEENAVSTFIAHNLQGYDGQFILQYCHENNVQPEVIINGTKIMRIYIPHLNIKFIDSYNFLPVALAQLPDMFELNELHKGYFPHFFNTAENQDYICPLPDSRYYGPDGMKQHAREKFLKWYEDERLKTILST